ncbi:MAG: ATP-dependent sacrificial sulfur transferase LarE [Desulfovibrionales bacterium]|nr:ATP-dependent sacrificial sulfur transferase LarE [Desulfovibrionales bacterium]
MVNTAKLEALESTLKGFFSPVLAFSGGIDSRFLAHVMHRACIPFTAIHITGEHVPRAESAKALNWLQLHNVPYQALRLSPLAIPAIACNDDTRCYHCKRYLYETIKDMVKEQADGDREPTILDGTNSSDMNEYRPGLQALKELGIVSPLADCGISKTEVRNLAVYTDMENADQPATPCLLTRFAYGSQPTDEILEQVEHCEVALRRFGLRNFRLRILEDGSHLLQVACEEKSVLSQHKAAIEDTLARSGFEGTLIDSCEHVSGFYDRHQPEK